MLGKGLSDDVTVALSNPARANLTLSQTYNTESESVGMQVSIFGMVWNFFFVTRGCRIFDHILPIVGE